MNTRSISRWAIIRAAYTAGVMLLPLSNLAQIHAGEPVAPPHATSPVLPAPVPSSTLASPPPPPPPVGTSLGQPVGVPIQPALPLPPIDPNTGLPVRYAFPGTVEGKRLASFNIDNIPLENVVDDLRTRFREINFLVPKAVQKAADERNIVLKLRLNNVNLRDILNGIIYATDGDVTWSQVAENMVVFQVRPDPQSPSTQPLRAPPANRNVQVINLSRVWAGLSTDDTERLIKEIREITIKTLAQLYENFNPDKDMTEANYHPGTGVLVLVGPDYANKVFMDILKNVDSKRWPALEEKKKAETGAVESSGSSSQSR